MCRIAGLFNITSQNLSQDIIIMRDAMKRGGPDDAGIFIHPRLPLALAHRRLSIIDLSKAGHQPMQTDDGKYQLVFNGEIYNYREIRKELQQLGYYFQTNTDTEVILYSYKHWGKSCFDKFNGMFALALWDEDKSELILARDHAGIKPLYYYFDHQSLIFASEIRAFKAIKPGWKTNELWKPLFFMFGHLPEPVTTLSNVKTLPKGSWLSIHLPAMKSQIGHFDSEEYTSKIFSYEEALEVIRNTLPKAVERHLISDAPIGLFLSGGIDSSLLTLLAAPVLKEKLQTLSIQFEEAEFNEEAYQQIIVAIAEAKHKSFLVSLTDFENALPDILNAMDQPSNDGINTYFISLYARQCGLKTVLSGLGADELFGGYPSFLRFKQWQYLKYIPGFITDNLSHSKTNSLSKLYYRKLHPMISLYLVNRSLFSLHRAAELSGLSIREVENSLGQIEIPDHSEFKTLNANAVMETDLYMKNQLLKDADYMSMWHGLEIRVPFLDKELVNAITGIAPSIKFKANIPKSLLIEAFATVLPAEIWNRKKQGFTFPFHHWLKTSENLKPQNKKETLVFDEFNKGKLHWSRYWAIKVAGMEKFN